METQEIVKQQDASSKGSENKKGFPVKLIIIVLACVLVLGGVAAGIYFFKREKPPVPSVLEWSFNEADGTLTITGVGHMDDFSIPAKAEWYIHKEKVTKVVLGDEVTTIGKNAFYNYDSLTTVVAGKSLTFVGYRAFYSCDNLKSVSLPATLTEIGDLAFYNCKAFDDFTFEGATTWWNGVVKGRKWDENSIFTAVKCADGNVKVERVDPNGEQSKENEFKPVIKPKPPANNESSQGAESSESAESTEISADLSVDVSTESQEN